MLTEELKSNGILGSIANHTAGLATLDSCSWFDSQLPSSSIFVADHAEMFKRRYAGYCSEIASRCFKTLAHSLQAQNAALLQNPLQQAFLPQLEYVAKIFPAMERQFAIAYSSAVRCWCCDQATRSFFVVGAINLDCHSINQVLEMVHCLQALPYPNKDALEEVADALKEVLDNLSKKLQAHIDPTLALMKSNGRFDEKRALLDAAEMWREYQHVQAILPPHEELRQAVLGQVNSYATELEQEIREQCGEGIDQKIEVLRRMAEHVDKHIDNAAAVHASHLSSLVETRRAGVDAILEQRINENNFAGIREHLAPLADSKDTIQREKYQRYIRVIRLKAQSFVDTLMAGMHDKAIVEANVPLLMDQDLLQLCPDVDVQAIQKEMNKSFSQELTKLEAAHKRMDFGAVLRHSDGLHRRAHRYISKKNQQRYDELDSQAKMILAGVERQVDAFLERLKKECEAGSTKCLHQSLHLLAPPGDTPASAEAQDDRIVECYSKATRQLSFELTELHTLLNEEVKSNEFSRTIATLQALQKEWDRGLKSHVSLPFNVEHTLMEVQQRQEEMYSEFRQSLWSKSDFAECIKKQMDALQKKCNQRLASQWSKREYASLRGQIGRIVEEICQMAHAKLREGSHGYGIVKRQYDVLSHIGELLSKHVDVKSRLQDIENALTSRMQANPGNLASS